MKPHLFALALVLVAVACGGNEQSSLLLTVTLAPDAAAEMPSIRAYWLAVEAQTKDGAWQEYPFPTGDETQEFNGMTYHRFRADEAVRLTGLTPGKVRLHLWLDQGSETPTVAPIELQLERGGNRHNAEVGLDDITSV